MIFLIASSASSQHWQSSDGPVPLLIDSNLVRIRLVAEPTDEVLQSFVDNVEEVIGVAKEIKPFEGFVACSLRTKDNYALTVETLYALEDVYMVEPFYRKQNGDPHMFGVSFCAVFFNEPFEAEMEKLASDYGVELGRQIGDRIWVFHNLPESGLNIIDIANLFHDLDQVKAALPDFDVHIKFDSFDPYTLYDFYNDFQHHIKRVIGDFNSNSVWDFAGLDDTVYVSIVDDGLTSHDDLPADRILTGYDFFFDDTDPTPGRHKAHGMAVAGIIGANHSIEDTAIYLDSTGIISMNPIVKFIPIKIQADTTRDYIPHSKLTDAMKNAFENIFELNLVESDIVVCCWHLEDSVYQIPLPNLDIVINQGFEHGRFWRGEPQVEHGTAIFFSAGNDNTSVAYPARNDACFAVGAIDTLDVKQSYSNYGTELDLVAYSADSTSRDFWSIDQMDTLGVNPYHSFLRSPHDIPPWECGYDEYNDSNYNCHFTGTSAAAPLVAGTATLLLARMDTLSADTIYSILKHSAITELKSGTIIPPDTLYGWGCVDAYRAMLSIVRGDVNNDASINLADITYLVNKVYSGGPDPMPDSRVGNVDCDPDGKINLADITKLIAVVYSSEPLSIPCYVY